MKRIMRLFLYLIPCVLLCTACTPASAGEQSVSDPTSQLQYEENDAPLSYDELLLWAGDLGAAMASAEVLSSEDRDGLVAADYGHARILWSGAAAPKIVSMDIVEPNLACPRGVFIGNPLRKVTAYYPSESSASGERAVIYRDQLERLSRPACRYGYIDDNLVVFGAACVTQEEVWDHLRLIFTIEDETVRSIHFQHESGLTSEQMDDILATIQV